MKRGDIIVNPWVSLSFFGELNAMYATIYLGNNTSLDYKGRKHTWADGLHDSTKSAVKQITKDGEEVRVFKTINEAAEAVGVRQSGISACARGIKPTSGGYKWQYFVE